MRLFVTEKPSVARDLAAVLGARTAGDACLEGPGVRVTWCLGHLVETATPEAHDPRWKRWDPEQLPILPRKLQLAVSPSTAGHFAKVRRHLRARDLREVVNACDAGREGELIFRYVYELSGCERPVLRFWVSSLTPAAIQRGLAGLQPASNFDALGAAARCRAEADWLVGINATRALTSRASTLLSVGRVQTPTLALLVSREQAIERFVPEDYFEVEARLEAAAGTWVARWIGAVGAPEPGVPQAAGGPGPQAAPDPQAAGRIRERARAEALAARLRGSPASVVAAERSQEQVPPPQLHHLTSLQQLANRRFQLTAQQTLAAAQSLYERHKLLTYPRTDSRHLTQDVARGLPQVVEALAAGGPWAPVARQLAADGLPRLGRRFVDDAQVGDHHAIVPTGQIPDPSRLQRAELLVFELVARRTLAALLPPAIYARTRLEAVAAGERLEARGRARLSPGWEVVEPPARAPGAEDLLPPVEAGDPARILDTRILEKQTRPPPRYSEASLLGAMERAGRSLEDAALRAAMREAGLGTPATRAATLETLIDRGYVGREGKLLVPLPLGRALVEAIPVPVLTEATLTGEWESRLQAIAEGRAEAMPFRRDIRAFVRAVVGALLAGPRIQTPDRPSRGPGGPRGKARAGPKARGKPRGKPQPRAGPRARGKPRPKGRPRPGSDPPG